MAAMEHVDGRRRQWLRHQVRHAHAPIDLRLLRGAVFDALAPRGPEARQLRIELLRALESVMPRRRREDDDLRDGVLNAADAGSPVAQAAPCSLS